MKPVKRLPGILDLLVLKVIKDRPLSGSDIRREIERRSGGRLQVGSGSWIDARNRLELKHLKGTRGTSLEGRKNALLYGLTNAGRYLMIQRSQEWRKFSLGVALIVGNAGMREAAAASNISFDFTPAEVSDEGSDVARLSATITEKGKRYKIAIEGAKANEFWELARKLARSLPGISTDLKPVIDSV